MCDLSNVEESVGVSEVAWLAEGEIPKAAVTLLSGEPGSGKSFVACTLAASVSLARGARVVFVHSEPAERLRARLARAGADSSRIEVFGRFPDKSKIENAKSEIATRLDSLIASLTKAGGETGAGLIVIDDLESLLGKALSAAELAETADRLNEVARASGAAVLAVVRSATTTEGRVTARTLDRLMRAADVVWMVAADRDLLGRRWLVPLKNNLAPLPEGKLFQVVEGRVEWLRGAVPDDALLPGSRRSVERADRQTAGQWLFEALRDRDVPSRLLYAQAKQCGFSRNTILRAAHQMGMHSHKCAFDGGWKYSLRDVAPEVIEAYRSKPVGTRRQGTDGSGGFAVGAEEGFGIQDSGFSEPEGPPASETAEHCSKSPKAPNMQAFGEKRENSGSHRPKPDQARIIKAPATDPSPQTPSPQSLAPSLQSPTPRPQPGPKQLPPFVPPEPELRDHLGRTNAKSVEKWEQWYHQWHREIRQFNGNYRFET
ncbi:MAG TPA: AAA family ATPase [Pirellulales bacterium]